MKVFDIINPIDLTYPMKLNIDSIALKDDIYYINTIDDFNYTVDKTLLRRLCLYDKSNLITKAFRKLQNLQVIDTEGITDIEDINIINNELTEEETVFKEEGIYIPKQHRTKEINVKDIDLSLEEIENMKIEPNFDLFNFADMYQYILNTNIKHAYLYDILSNKFDKEYSMEAEQQKFFENLSLKAHSQFANVYYCKDGLHKIQEEIWINKSKEYEVNKNEISEALYDTNKSFSIKHIEALYKTNLITEKEYNITIQMADILYTLLHVNFKYMKFTTLESCDMIINFIDYIDRTLKNTNISKILRFTEEEIIGLINKYTMLAEELNEIDGD